MASFSRLQVANHLLASGIMPLFYHPDPDFAFRIVEACYQGGIRAMEFTNRADFAHLVYGELRQRILKELPDMMFGVGSIVDAPTTSLYIQLGADFIVSPIMNPEMAKICNRRKILWLPGCGTLSEISEAEEAGAEIIKVFPGSTVGGPKFIQSVTGPCPWTSLMPTGGVSPDRENLKAWFDAGAVCVGMGSKLITKDIIAREAFAELTEKVRETLATIAAVRV